MNWELLVKAGLMKGVRGGPGRLSAKTESVGDAAEAIERVRSFGGEGWLCATDSPDIRRFSSAAPLPLLKDSWPLWAEAAKEGASLHLCRGSEGWQITTLLRAEGDGVLLESSMRAKDGQGTLRYEVFWEATGELKELRPAAFRFVGFGRE